MAKSNDLKIVQRIYTSCFSFVFPFTRSCTNFESFNCNCSVNKTFFATIQSNKENYELPFENKLEILYLRNTTVTGTASSKRIVKKMKKILKIAVYSKFLHMRAIKSLLLCLLLTSTLTLTCFICNFV